MPALILLAVLLLAYSNGANDNFKGVATLFGSATTDYRRALAWATVTTLAGALLALVLANGLVSTFKGRGLVPDTVTQDPDFLLSVGLGAGLTVLVATLAGLPVSTTHALIGGLIGAGLLASGGELRLSALLKTFLLPLLCSPIVSMLSTLVVYPLLRGAGQTLGIASDSCLCVEAQGAAVSPGLGGGLVRMRSGLAVRTGTAAECATRYQGRIWGVEASPALDVLHYLSAGAVGFARGLNDAPKIVALLLAGEVLAPRAGLAIVAAVMALGGVLNARKVAETMSHRITSMSPGQGFAANLVTGTLVVLASRYGLPVSTTHVSVGSLFGVGIVNGTARKGTILAILTAWLTTLPLGALLAGATYWLCTNVA